MEGGEPDINPAGAYVWNWFWDAHRSRQPGFSGIAPLACTELSAWAGLTGKIIRPQEWEIIRNMDEALIDAASKKADRADKSPPKAGEGRDYNAAAFDAVFG